jgi:hypothetical protein
LQPDLRLYGWVQFFPCIALPLLFVACPPRYSGTSYCLIAAAFYSLAKLFEFYDHAIYSVGFILSGHALKHFAAASALLCHSAVFPNSPAGFLILSSRLCDFHGYRW